MSDTTSNSPINPESVAAKLAASRNFEQPAVTAEMEENPRFKEALLFLQFVSLPENYPGGLRKFSIDLIEESMDLLGTAEMRAAGADLSPRQARAIYEALPYVSKRDFDEFGKLARAEYLARLPDLFEDEDEKAERIAAERERRRQRSREEAAAAAREEARLAAVNRKTLIDLCQENAVDNLASYLRDLCEHPHVLFRRQASHSLTGAPWYFSEVANALLRFIDRRKEVIGRRIAETEVTRLIFKWLGKARNTRRAIMISGNSRFGKTEALRAWCAMNPGVARLVNTPASNSEGDLLREVAKALGIETGPHSGTARLRDRIDYVLSNTGLMLVFDESHLIFPVNFSRNTAPARLNWVRRSVMDAGLPCAFCCTPQSYGSAKRRFVKATGYAIEQFDGRLLKTVELPESLSPEDLLAVARIHFPELEEDYLQYVVETMVAPERNYLSDLEKIAALARDNAQECGRKVPEVADIDSAIADVLPVAAPTKPSQPSKEGPEAAPRSTPAKALHRPGKTLARSGRAVAPVSLESAGGRINFGSEIPDDLTVAAGT